MDHRSECARQGAEGGLAEVRRLLSSRLDDLRGLGLLGGGGESTTLEAESGLLELALSMADALESTQRRVIETSIQVISLRELVAKLLSLHTSEAVAETVTIYLQKAFNHERVLVGVYDGRVKTLEGWCSTRNGEQRCRRFRLEGEWGGALRGVIEENRPVRAAGQELGSPFLTAETIPEELEPFREEALGPYLAYPLSGRGPKEHRVVGALMVGRGPGVAGLDDMDAGILESVADAVGTALENVILEEDIRREEAFRKDIMHSLDAGLIAVGLNGRVLTVNASAERLT